MIPALEFDGVMHPVNSRTETKFCRLALLEEWLWARPGMRVLIGSSWRDAHPLDEMVSFFSKCVQARIVGSTPVYKTLSEQHCARSFSDAGAACYPRLVEIERWLDRYRDTQEPWAALDDDPTLFEPGCARLVLCNPGVGLTECQLEQLDRTLGLERPPGDGRE